MFLLEIEKATKKKKKALFVKIRQGEQGWKEEQVEEKMSQWEYE
jgi:hypothetical protein